MSDKFINRKPNRLKDFNYSQAGYYFITISTKNNFNYLGEATESNIILNDYGKIAEKYWSYIPKYYKNVGIDVYTIMPNHIHGILIIEDEPNNINSKNDNSNKNIKYGKISIIINSYKNIVTKTIRNKNNELNFGWHRSFYDHVLRDDKSLAKIREYIIQNPLKLFLDKSLINDL